MHNKHNKNMISGGHISRLTCTVHREKKVESTAPTPTSGVSTGPEDEVSLLCENGEIVSKNSVS